MGPIPILGARIREVWPKDERKILDRCAKLFNSHGDKLMMRCGYPLCTDPDIRLYPDPLKPNWMVLRCGCRDRAFEMQRAR